MNTNSQTLAPLLLVTGVSGAGKSSALGVLEDLGYEAVDNLPVSLIGRLLGDGEFPHPIAIGIDIRTRDFNAPGFLEELNVLFRRPDMDVNLLFLDCDDEILGRRFEETRRRHPLALDRPAADGIARERELTEPLRRWASQVIDTTSFTSNKSLFERGAWVFSIITNVSFKLLRYFFATCKSIHNP
mgnify:CR=1 FL=1